MTWSIPLVMAAELARQSALQPVCQPASTSLASDHNQHKRKVEEDEDDLYAEYLAAYGQEGQAVVCAEGLL